MTRKRGYSRAFKAHGETGKQIQIAGIPAGLLAAARARARRDGLSMRATVLHLLSAYADGKVTISTTTTTNGGASS